MFTLFNLYILNIPDTLSIKFQYANDTVLTYERKGLTERESVIYGSGNNE